jgi:hypothetical protein
MTAEAALLAGGDDGEGTHYADEPNGALGVGTALRRIVSEAERAGMVVRDVLDFSRAEHTRRALQRIAQRLGGVAFGRPADTGQRGVCLGNVEVGHADDVHACDVAGLAEDHRAELAGTDQTHPDGTPCGSTCRQHGVEIHLPSFPKKRSLSRNPDF